MNCVEKFSRRETSYIHRSRGVYVENFLVLVHSLVARLRLNDGFDVKLEIVG